jgi:hypothetical protein
VDVNLSSDEETTHPMLSDVAADQKVLAGDDTGDDGATAARPTAPGLIGSGMLEKAKPSTADQPTIVAPTSSMAENTLPPPGC